MGTSSTKERMVLDRGRADQKHMTKKSEALADIWMVLPSTSPFQLSENVHILKYRRGLDNNSRGEPKMASPTKERRNLWFLVTAIGERSVDGNARKRRKSPES